MLVENLGGDAEENGLHRSDIQMDVELKLRLAGIKVLTEEESLNDPSHVYLYVNVLVKVDKTPPVSGLVAYNISCELKQYVSLVRDPSVVRTATTWDTGGLGLIGKDKLRNIRNYVKDQVDHFLNAYLSVNPKQ